MHTLETIGHFIATWYWAPMLLVYTGVIVTILSENRNPSKSLAYIMVIVFLPIVGLIVYYLVGRKPVFKRWAFKRKGDRDRRKMAEHLDALQPQMEAHLQTLQQKVGDLSQPFAYLYAQRQTLISTGNTVQLLLNGEEKFPELFKAIAAATTSILVEYYIFTADDLGNHIADLLIQKAGEGVCVRVIVDDVGSNHIGDIPKRLEAAGIPLLKTMPVTFTSLANSNYRNHRKIVAIDGKVGFIGGINIDDRYWNNGKHKLFWRDTALKIEGNAVKLLQIQFLLSWLFSGGKDDFLEKELHLLNQREAQHGSATVAIAASGPSAPVPYILEAILLAISQARKSVRICTPYYIPNTELTTALQIAASTGIEVELMIPEKSDSFIVQHASFSFIKPLLERGVKVYLYQKGFIHAKTISIDETLSFIGTVNMDTRSFYLNFEITSLVYDPALSQRLEASFAEDKSHSRCLELQGWQERPVLQRGFDSVCRLVAPLL